MVTFSNPDLVKSHQIRNPNSKIRVVLSVNPPAQRLRFPSSKGTHFVIPKTLLGSLPANAKPKKLILDDFAKQISITSTAKDNGTLFKRHVGAEPIQATVVLDNRFGRFNYIAPGTAALFQKQKKVNGKKVWKTFLVTYVWDIERTAAFERPEIKLTCYDRLHWVQMCNGFEDIKTDQLKKGPISVIKRIAKTFDIPLGNLFRTKANISKLCEEISQANALEQILTVLNYTASVQGKIVQFDVHARDGRLNIVPIQKPSRVVRFTDDTMIHSGVSYTEAHEDTFATRYKVEYKVEVPIEPSTTTSTGTFGTQPGESTLPGSSDPWVYTAPPTTPDGQPVKGLHEVSTNGSKTVATITYIGAPNDASVTTNLKIPTDPRLQSGARFVHGGIAGGDSWYTFPNIPANPAINFQNMDITTAFLAFRGQIIQGPGVPQRFVGKFYWKTYTRKRAGRGESRSRPTSRTPSTRSVKNEKNRKKKSTSTDQSQPTGTTTEKRSVKKTLKVNNATETSFKYQPYTDSKAKTFTIPNSYRAVKGGNNLWFFKDFEYSVPANSPFRGESRLLFRGTITPPPQKYNGTFEYYTVENTSAGGTGSGGSGSSDLGTTEETEHFFVNPSNPDIQNAFGIVTKTFDEKILNSCAVYKDPVGKGKGKLKNFDDLTKSEKKIIARKILDKYAWRPRYTLNFSSKGIVGLWANKYIYVHSHAATVKGLFLIKSITYTQEAGKLDMSITLDIGMKNTLEPRQFNKERGHPLRY